MSAPTKQTVFDTVDDLLSEFLYYGRKEDEDLPRGAIEAMIERGEITVDEIVERFRAGLVNDLSAS